MMFNGSLVATQPLRQTIRNNYRADEDKVLEFLLPIANIGVNARSRAWERARQLVLGIRQAQVGKGGVDALLNEFSLSTEEGLVLMCLAEALLRVPDNITADRLIRDKLANGDWGAHIGNSKSIFVNISAWGLLLTGKLVNYSDEDKKQQFNVLKRTCGRLGEPVIRQAVRYAMQIMGEQFVMGTNITAALERATKLESKGFRYSYDMLGEGARTMADADRYFASYMNAIDTIGKAARGRGPFSSPGISVKLSAIHPRYEFAKRDRVMAELVPRLKSLVLAAKAYDINFTIDAEEADRLDFSLDIIEAVFSDPDLGDWQGFGLAVQAYQKRGFHVIEWLRDLTVRVGRKMMVRLVKGAYWDSEIKVCQVEGFAGFPVFTRKPSTDVSYQACAKKLLEYRDTIYPQFATHNAYTVATIMEMTKDYTGFEFQCLHGMGDALYDTIVNDDKIPCRIYAPVGEHADLLAYLVRRLLENGANSSFVNNIIDETIPVESLLTDPVEVVSGWQHKANKSIPQAAHLYGAERLNSNGLDLTDVDEITAVKNVMDQWLPTLHNMPVQENATAVTNPANLDEVIGYIRHADAEEMQQIISQADAAFQDWSQTEVTERANLLRRVGDSLEQHRDELLALCIKEAGKTALDSIAEVREAIDFCRYYAARAELLFAEPQQARGVFLCISPWNFPLAIFLGQVAAAIVVGNTVVAKPAEQTSLVAMRTLELMLECSMPEHVVQLVIAPGRAVGEHIVPDLRIQGVMFTGSTETGCWIARKLAERGGEPVPLIAETGGQNCMIVDSTALPEQVVDDVISSGFQSAGQRCSALRVLFLQEDVADNIITMLKGAMAELKVADPAYLDTDLGPVIDAKAHERLTSHVQYLHDKATLHYSCEIPAGDNHYFFAPHLYEISDLTVLEREVFGPVVHIIRFKAEEVDKVIQQINATGYGLTMGVHSRIDQFTKQITRDIKAGNIYVNRNMIGAVVGVQPFGGRALSGTGPKAGGPLYITRLVKDNDNTDCPELAPETRLRLLSETTSSAVAYAMPVAAIAQQQWSQININQRTSVLRQFLALLASNTVVNKNEPDLEKILTLAQKKLQRVERELQKPITLPGPTGESNQLTLDPRGTVALIRDETSSFQHWLLAIITALATGNAVITAVEEQDLLEAEACIKALIQAGMPMHLVAAVRIDCLTTLLAHVDLAGAMVEVSSAVKPLCAELLASREGAILPLITSPAGPRLLQRLVTEKTITINTTAAGGNATLMTMEDNLA
ncbi:bifunctional proline dehydrogenase/L-glutamate gamma-semialdehyde dehydrogenase PutA [Rheinheimera sp. MMS21-TC3]|uniref:bifunctional proline dehydrogenase/L-glutamate gamma-semialdehyde dehydrogenase PutA n=1 Tax=Rheinheimera sp. MMS21-TC3 TaxID=3072790 RepID=UPI0028C48492|nr:bifunctional proline dehydrogenase/L-glutamate gamma-semialdehyde dehydrogenase PutA [Rheinheimera sp. MMS21-TC3]WNO60113.1 bifunctional proline dehydrogenase/L-glutamate gamma-semialdehyde dehydrogenase PutA [Rheinheimera sp. MMS21-TC3]